MPSVDITFKTAAELAGARAVQQNLERQIGQAKALGKDYSELSKQLAAVNDRIAKSGQKGSFMDLVAQVPLLQKFGSILDSVATKAGLAVGALAALVKVVSKAVKEFAEAESQVAGLDAALAQHGLLTNELRERYQALAGELQKTTAIADDQWIGVLQRLTQFGSKPETIGIDVEAVKNLAGLLEGDVVRAAEMYSKALAGQYEAFGRLGIRIGETGSQTEKLNQLQDSSPCGAEGSWSIAPPHCMGGSPI